MYKRYKGDKNQLQSTDQFLMKVTIFVFALFLLLVVPYNLNILNVRIFTYYDLINVNVEISTCN